MNDLISAHPHDLPLLKNPKQLDLHGLAHALHLVQKQSSGVGELKQSRPPALFCPRKRPLLVAEQLALQQVLRHGRHIDGHKGAVAALGGAVYRVGEQLLSGSGLSDQKHRGFGEGHAL